MKDERNWTSVLKNYTLMQDAHYENDAQNWHIIGIELVSLIQEFIRSWLLFPVTIFARSNCYIIIQFNSRFERRNLKHLRLYLKQPSPSWLDFSLRNITVYTKRIDYSNQTSSLVPASRLNSAGSASGHKGGAAGFDAFRSKLRSNLQGVKKQTKSAATNGDTDSEGPAAFNSAKLVGSAVHHYTEEVRRLELCPGFI